MFKRILPIMITLMLVFGTVSVVNAAGVKVIVDGKDLNAQCTIVNGRTLAPVRAISEAMGATVAWDNAEKKITISKQYWETTNTGTNTGIRTAYMWIGKKTGSIDGMFEIEMDVPAQIISGNTMIPVKALGDMLQAKVDWNQKTKTVTITSSLASNPTEAKTDALKHEVDLKNTTSNYLKEVNEYLKDNELGELVKEYGYNVLWSGHDFAMTYMFIEVQNNTNSKISEHQLYLQMVNPETKKVVESVPIIVNELEAGERTEIVLNPAPTTYKEYYKSIRLSPVE